MVIYMLAIEEYIAKRKKKDNLNEFDFKLHSENMSTVIQYVMDYFNNYLNLEDYSYEQVKTQQIIDRFKKGITERYPESVDFVIEFYWKYKKRIDNLVEKAFEEIQDSQLFYLETDFRQIAEYICRKKLRMDVEEDLVQNLIIMAREHQKNVNEPPDRSDMKELDNTIVDWVMDVYRTYHVDLLDFSLSIAYHYEDLYEETLYDTMRVNYYKINRYEYRYQENPFDINAIYERNKHRTFIKGMKGELEMLIMYCWLFFVVDDFDYWPEYVNLCVSNARVNLAKHRRVLLPVKIKGLEYPADMRPHYNYVETKDGVLKTDPGKYYIVRIIYDKKNDQIWKDRAALEEMIQNLQRSFKTYGAPKLLEFTSPYTSTYYQKEDFYEKYILLEKGMRRFHKLQIALVNGHTKNDRGKQFMVSNIDDIVQMRNTCRELKLKLKLAVDFTDSGKRNPLKKDERATINTLCEMRPFIVAIHINGIDHWQGYNNLYGSNEKHHIYAYGKESLSEFLSGLGLILQDNQTRFFIPDTVKNNIKLEELVDIFLRGGCYFKEEADDGEE